jgi:hypothetical protein
MKLLVRLRKAALALPLLIPTLHAAAGPATIIDTAAGCDATAERTNLAAALTSAGNTVTTITTGVVPGSLAGQNQVWDIRCTNVLTAGEITIYTTYLQGGGSLFIMGENTGFALSRDNSILSFISGLGGGSLTLTSSANSQTALAPFNAPNALTTVTYRAVGGTTTPGTGVFVTKDNANFGGALAFGPGNLSGAPTGSLIIVWDVNFLDNSRTAGEIALVNNLIAYLATPVVLPTPLPPPVPLPPTLPLVLIGVAGAAAAAWRRRAA